MGEKFVQQHVDELGLKDIVQRNPKQEAQKTLQRRLQRQDVLGVLHHKFAELIDELKLFCETLLQVIDLFGRKLFQRELENFLAEQLENLHVVGRCEKHFRQLD